MATALDKTDYAILEVLRDNSRLSVREIAARVHRSPTPIFDRLRRMESEGVIEKYTVRLNDDKQAGVSINSFIRTAVEKQIAAML